MQKLVWQHARTLELCGMQPFCSTSQACNKGLLSNLRSGAVGSQNKASQNVDRAEHKSSLSTQPPAPSPMLWWKNHHGHRHDMLHNKGSTGLSRLLHEITVQNHSKAMPNLFWQTSKTTPCWIKGKKHNHRYYYPGHVYNWISVEPGPGYTRYPDMPGANTPAPII